MSMTTDDSTVYPLPKGCQLRPANPSDAWAIRRLVFSAWLDPTQIRWTQFWVIEAVDGQDRAGTLIACGQLRDLEDAQELGSLVVKPRWRHQGLGTTLTEHLIHQATKPLYLECLGDRLLGFYMRLGFVVADWETMPQSMRAKFHITRRLASLFRLPLHVLEYSAVGTVQNVV